MEEGREKRGKGVGVTAIKYSDTHVQKWCKKKLGVLFGNYIKKESKITKGAQPRPIAKLGFGSPGYTEDRDASWASKAVFTACSFPIAHLHFLLPVGFRLGQAHLM